MNRKEGRVRATEKLLPGTRRRAGKPCQGCLGKENPRSPLYLEGIKAPGNSGSIKLFQVSLLLSMAAVPTLPRQLYPSPSSQGTPGTSADEEPHHRQGRKESTRQRMRLLQVKGHQQGRLTAPYHSHSRYVLKHARCSPLHQMQEETEAGEVKQLV
jgi:hypothetical protein